MRFYWFPPLLAGILDLLLCLVVLWHAPHRRLNQIFALAILTLTSWNFDIAALYLFHEDYFDEHYGYEMALYWSKVFRYGMLFIPPALYHLALAFTERWTLGNRLLLAIGYSIAFVLCLGNASGLLVSQLKEFTWGYYPVARSFYKYHSYSDLFYFGATLFQLICGLRMSESARQRQQLKIVLMGFTVALPCGLTNLLPAYGISIYPLGNIGNVFLCGAFTYAIVRHRLLDLELIITKTVASVTTLILWLVPLWILTAWMQQRIYGTSDTRLLLFALAVFVLSGLVFPWLLGITETGVRRMFWGQKYDSLQALSVFQKMITHKLDQKTIVSDLREVLSDALQTGSVGVYLRPSDTAPYTDSQEGGAVFLPEDAFLHALQLQEEPVVREEAALKEKDLYAIRIATTLAEHQSEVCVPLRTQDRLVGFLLLGKKRNRAIFSSEDLRLLSTLGAEVAVALENARLYTELRNSQVLLARSDRMAALGTLAAGIAHEIRNPLVAIHTFTQLLPEQIDDPEFRTTFVNLANSELERVSTLISDLLTFARPSPTLSDVVQVNDLADQVVRLLTGQARKKGVALSAQLSPALPPLMIDQGQIKQVLMNLVLNAIQATDSGGTVTIITTPASPDGQECCQIEVHDTGSGISDEQKEKIFDPFFTTKETGTGLGLAITYQIVREHGGTLDVESTLGQGTRFLARLPLTHPPLQTLPLNGNGEKEVSSTHPLPPPPPVSSLAK